MTPGEPGPGVSDTESFEKALAAVKAQRFILRLYIVGATAASQRAVQNLSRICEDELAGRYTLEVIDVYQHPELAAGEQILAAPTLVRLLPEPIARLVGDMSDRDRVLLGLDLRPVPTDER
jgi:circadian clock protein KaiB